MRVPASNAVARVSTANGPTTAPLADLGVDGDGVLHDGSRPTMQSTRRASGPISQPPPIDRAALQDRAREEGHVGRQLHRDVDVGLRPGRPS